jgi:hypothetical protein
MLAQEYNRAVSYSVGKDFEIKPGHVTNLGRLLLVMDSKNMGRYLIISIDNTKQIMKHLMANRPDIYGSLAPEKFITSGKFIDKETLITLRNQFAAAALKTQLGITKRTANNYIVHGGLGTMMDVGFDVKQKKVKHKTILETNTYDSINNCRSKVAVTACITESNAQQIVYVYDGKSLTKSSMPVGIHYSKIYVEEDKGVIFISDDLSIMRSKDLGNTWHHNDDFRVKIDLPTTLKTTTVDDGVYIYTNKSSRVLYYSVPTGEFSSLPNADNIETVSEVLPTSKGIYLMPDNSTFTDSKLLLLSPDSDNWKVRDIDTNGCHKIKALDNNKGEHLEIECISGLKKRMLESKDAGMTWIEISSSWI